MYTSKSTSLISGAFLSDVSFLHRQLLRSQGLSPSLACAPCLLPSLHTSFIIRRCNVVGCKCTWGRTNNLFKQRRESFQSMIESDNCQIDSDIHTHQRTVSRLRAPGPNDIIKRLILILSRTQYTLFQVLPLGKRSKYWLYEGTQILRQLRSVLGWFQIISECTIVFAP